MYPDYGVFSPTCSEYVDLVDDVAAAFLPSLKEGASVLELGTGTGVLAAVLARRGAVRVTATDVNPRAVACARANLDRLGVGERCEVVEADLWLAVSETTESTESTESTDAADIVVFNPPWLPGTPTSELELGIYAASSEGAAGGRSAACRPVPRCHLAVAAGADVGVFLCGAVTARRTGAPLAGVPGKLPTVLMLTPG